MTRSQQGHEGIDWAGQVLIPAKATLSQRCLRGALALGLCRRELLHGPPQFEQVEGPAPSMAALGIASPAAAGPGARTGTAWVPADWTPGPPEPCVVRSALPVSGGRCTRPSARPACT